MKRLLALLAAEYVAHRWRIGDPNGDRPHAVRRHRCLPLSALIEVDCSIPTRRDKQRGGVLGGTTHCRVQAIVLSDGRGHIRPQASDRVH